MGPETRVEIQNLLSALCDGEITDVEFARLQELLGAEAECRQMYLEYMDMHASLLIDTRLTDAHSRAAEPARASELPSAPAAQKKADPDSAPALPKTKERILHWGRGNIRHALLVLGTLAASLLVQVFWLPPLFSERTPKKAAPQEDITSLKKGAYVATLVQTVDCVWDFPRDPGGNGARLAPGKLRLPQGVASIRFDGGPELIIEGPAEINLDSATAVTVLSGKVVFRATDSDVPFDLRTPSSTLVDVATEFAISVSAEAEELHVFEGELQRLSKNVASGSEPESVKAGESKRYESQSDRAGKPTIDPKQFVRHAVNPAKPGVDPNAGLLAYEGFDYPSHLALQNGKAMGGSGWAGPWRASFVRPGPKTERDRFSLNVKETLARTRTATPAIGGSFDYAGFAKVFRKLEKPVPLDADGVYYLSFLFRRHGPIEPGASLAVLFWTDDDYQQQNFLDYHKRLSMGVKGTGQVYAHLQRMTAQSTLPLGDDDTYVLVAKIAASRSKPDQVFLRVYGPADRVKSEETGRWSVQSMPFRSDQVFEWVELHVNGKNRQTIDEIRLGTTLASVTSPWIAAK